MDALNGFWALSKFTDRLAQTRSWARSVAAVNAQFVSFYIDAGRIYFNLAWHEGDPGDGHCVRLVDGKLWARPGWEKTKWLGPYQRAEVKSPDQEAAFYLEGFFTGCFKSDKRELWCLSPSDIAINGKRLGARLQMDSSEVPFYGTAFMIPTRYPPFLIFVPKNDGWAVFEDDWETSDGRRPIDPRTSAPWRRLRK